MRANKNDHKPGAGGQTGGHISENDRLRKDSADPVKVNQGDLYSEKGEGKTVSEGTPQQDVNNRITGTNPYTGTNSPQTERQKKAANESSEYGTEGNEKGSGTGK
jgi:hypothetical protein